MSLTPRAKGTCVAAADMHATVGETVQEAARIDQMPSAWCPKPYRVARHPWKGEACHLPHRDRWAQGEVVLSPNWVQGPGHRVGSRHALRITVKGYLRLLLP